MSDIDYEILWATGTIVGASVLVLVEVFYFYDQSLIVLVSILVSI